MSYTARVGFQNLPAGQSLKFAVIDAAFVIDSAYRDIELTEEFPGVYLAAVATVPATVAGWAVPYTGTLNDDGNFDNVTLVGLVGDFGPDPADVQASITVNADMVKIDGSTVAAQQAKIAFDASAGTQATGSIEILTNPPSGQVQFFGTFSAAPGVEYSVGIDATETAANFAAFLNGYGGFASVATATPSGPVISIVGVNYAASNLAITTASADYAVSGISGGVDPVTGYLRAGNSGYLPVALATDSQTIGSVDSIRNPPTIPTAQQIADTTSGLLTSLHGSGSWTAAGVTLAASQPNYAPLKPTVAGRTLDVSVGGEAGLDWANIGTPTTSVNLSNTSTSYVATAGTVSGVIAAINAIRTGTAQAGSATTITLDSGASSLDYFYRNTWVQITAGTGVAQVRLVSSYIGSTKVATVTPAWITNPASGSTFAILAVAPVYTSNASTGVGMYPISESGGIGAGSVAATIDVNRTGTFGVWATDAARYTTNGGATGVANLAIRAYEKTAYLNQTGTGLQGTTTSDASGRWAEPLNLDSGEYVVTANNPNDGFLTSTIWIKVP